MAFQPLGERVLVEPQTPESLTPGGIIIPDVGQDLPQQGQVLSVGPGAEALLKPGDLVMFGKYAGLSVKIRQRELLILDLPEILGIVQPDAPETAHVH